jgi:hypothetical protein
MVNNKTQWGACIWGEDGNRGTWECSTVYGHKRWVAHKIRCDRSNPPSCRHNRSYFLQPRDDKLGAAGAEELAKGDWPELRVLNIGWDELAVLLCIAHQYQHASLQLGRAGILSP